MMVFCETPRKRAFKAFKTSTEATRWLKTNAEKVINVRTAHGRIIVNHYAR